MSADSVTVAQGNRGTIGHIRCTMKTYRTRYMGSFLQTAGDGRQFFSFGLALLNESDQTVAIFSLSANTDVFANAGAEPGAVFELTGVEFTPAQDEKGADIRSKNNEAVFNAKRIGDVSLQLIRNGGIKINMSPKAE